MPTIPVQTAERDAAKAVVRMVTAVPAMTAISDRVHRGRRNPVTVVDHHAPNSAAAGRRNSDAMPIADLRRQPHPPCPLR